MQYKKHFLVIGAVIFAMFYSATLFAIGMHCGIDIKGKAEQTEPAALYTVKEYNGKIAVFEFGSTTPQRILDIDVSTLRQYDRLRFLNGVTLNSPYELSLMLEDFGS
ncbi:MAG: hypothetical protein M0R40_07820 [Firmicutes bacterium]|nr:hypothetical protein [Bacillota bacterium]